MSTWFEKLYGTSATFGVKIAFNEDTHPRSSDQSLVASWGTFELWAKGRCLTSSRNDDGSRANGVSWYLLPLIRWLNKNAPLILNQEWFPNALQFSEVESAAAWLLETEEPRLTLLEDEEDEWFEARDEWWRTHGLRRAIQSASLPNLFIRRLGHSIELSWDNESHPPSRTDIAFDDPNGMILLPAEWVASVLGELLREIPKVLESRIGQELEWPEPQASHPVWKMLVVPWVSELLINDANLAAYRDALDTFSATHAIGAENFLVPHNETTLLLRDAPVLPGADCEQLIELIDLLNRGRNRDGTCSFVTDWPTVPPETRRPWRQGYEAALEVRENLGLNGEPVSEMEAILENGQVIQDEVALHPSVDGIVVSVPERLPAVLSNPQSTYNKRWRKNMSLATGLGRLVMDASADSTFAQLESARAHWPSAARARAFAAMFLMPEDGLRDVIRNRGAVDTDTVAAIMAHFNTGAIATTWHLTNLRMLDEDKRIGILADLKG